MRKKQQNKNVRYGIIAVGLVVLFAFGRKLLNRLNGGLAMLSAKKDGEAVYNNQNTSDPSAVRLPFVRSVCDSVKNEVESFNQDEANIVRLLNSLSNGQEVAAASAYYQTANGRSLKADVEGALDSAGNPFGWFGGQGHWSNLKDYVKTNLV